MSDQSSPLRTGDIGGESSPLLEVSLSLLLPPARFRLLVEVVNVKLPRRPSSRRIALRLRTTSGRGGVDTSLVEPTPPL